MCDDYSVTAVGVDLYNQTTTGGCEIDSSGKRAGKGALIQWEMSGTLGESQDQTLFVWKETAADNPTEGGGWSTEGVMYTLNGTEVHAVCVGVDLYNQTITGGWQRY